MGKINKKIDGRKLKNQNTVQDTVSSKKYCVTCQRERSILFFYNSYNSFHTDGKSPMCKDCLINKIDLNDINTVFSILRQLDRPFLEDIWIISNKPEVKGLYGGKSSNFFGTYMKNISMPQYRNLKWVDSYLGNYDDKNSNIPEKENKGLDMSIELETEEIKTKITKEIIDRWGEGYQDEEYRNFERKYNMLRNNYQEKTAMHREALLTYVRYRVKEEMATALGRYKEAKEWGTLAKGAADAAKINPSQLSRADLSDGLDTVGQIVKAVESTMDIIEILPKFKKEPQDSVDLTLFFYINYIRRLNGFPEAKYEEIYKFYEDRKKEYENRMEFLREAGDVEEN